MPALFDELRINDLHLSNRIVIPPMCQYSAVDGLANEWHQTHYATLSYGGAGLMIVEATAVSPDGRITPYCLGLYDDATEAALAEVVRRCRRMGTAKLGLQIAHAGRKAATDAPWRGGGPLADDAGGWPVRGPSPIAFAPGSRVPAEMSQGDIDELVAAFVATAQRALRLSFDSLELHFAHGYLIHEFFSPVANHRTDGYGGSLKNRSRLALEITAAVRRVWPAGRPLGARISGSDWIDGAADAADAAALAVMIADAGVDYICVSSGGIAPHQKIAAGKGYQIGFAETVRAAVSVPVRTVGLIVDPEHADDIVRAGQADLVAVGRGFLDDPRWGWHAAVALGVDWERPPPYQRTAPRFATIAGERR